MHPFFFGIKRLHLRIVECGKALFHRVGLTPARFDVLRTIYERDGDVAQKVLVEFFGVADSTMSRMLAGLEEKGFIERARASWDGRRKSIRLTPEGVRAYKGAIELGVEKKNGEDIAAAIVSGDWHNKTDGIVMRRRVEKMVDTLVVARRMLHDTSLVRYPWRNAHYLEMPGLALEHDVYGPMVPRPDRKPPPWERPLWELQLRAFGAFKDDLPEPFVCPG